MGTGRTVLRGGTVVDGSGAPGRAADVLLEGDRIAALLPPGAPVDAQAAVVDVAGRTLCPGFIDVHTHDDLAVLRDPRLPAKVGQGVTTVVAGNCGVAAAPVGIGNPCDGFGEGIMGPAAGVEVEWTTVAEWAAAVERARPWVNVAFLAGHNALRLAACGGEERALDRTQLAALLEHAAEAMDAGAIGISTGLGYSPGRASTLEELVALARVCGRAGGMYASHLRDEGVDLLPSIDEALEISRQAECHVHVSHLKSAGRANWGRLDAVVERLRSTGVTTDVYPYTAASTGLMPALRATGADPVPSDYIISGAPGAEELEGKSLETIAAEWRLEAMDAARRIDELTEGRAAVVYFVMCEADVQSALRFERTMIGSDGLPLVGARPHPRLYGTFPRVLTRYVDELGILSFEEAVHRMTGLSAEVFGLRDRGRIAPGAFADLVVLDRDALEDRATYEDPARHPGGIEQVIVNGAVSWAPGTDGDAPGRAGRVLRRDEAVTARAA